MIFNNNAICIPDLSFCSTTFHLATKAKSYDTIHLVYCMNISTLNVGLKFLKIWGWLTPSVKHEYRKVYLISIWWYMLIKYKVIDLYTNQREIYCEDHYWPNHICCNKGACKRKQCLNNAWLHWYILTFILTPRLAVLSDEICCAMTTTTVAMSIILTGEVAWLRD